MELKHGRIAMLATMGGLVTKLLGDAADHAILGGGFKYFLFSPLFGEDSQFD